MPWHGIRVSPNVKRYCHRLYNPNIICHKSMNSTGTTKMVTHSQTNYPEYFTALLIISGHAFSWESNVRLDAVCLAVSQYILNTKCIIWPKYGFSQPYTDRASCRLVSFPLQQMISVQISIRIGRLRANFLHFFTNFVHVIQATLHIVYMLYKCVWIRADSSKHRQQPDQMPFSVLLT